jgi:hypothetical protein
MIQIPQMTCIIWFGASPYTDFNRATVYIQSSTQVRRLVVTDAYHKPTTKVATAIYTQV